MRYQVMMFDVHIDYYHALKHRLGGMDVNYTIALTMQDVARNRQIERRPGNIQAAARLIKVGIARSGK